MKVAVTYAEAKRQMVLDLEVEDGASAEQAIQASGILGKVPDIDLTRNKIGIFSKVVPLEQVLTEGDRVEIYRPAIGKPPKKSASKPKAAPPPRPSAADRKPAGAAGATSADSQKPSSPSPVGAASFPPSSPSTPAPGKTEEDGVKQGTIDAAKAARIAAAKARIAAAKAKKAEAEGAVQPPSP